MVKFGIYTLPNVDEPFVRRTDRLFVEKPIPGASVAYRTDVGSVGLRVTVRGHFTTAVSATIAELEALGGTSQTLDLEDDSTPFTALASSPLITQDATKVVYEIEFAATEVVSGWQTILPQATDTYDLGSEPKLWRSLYLGSSGGLKFYTALETTIQLSVIGSNGLRLSTGHYLAVDQLLLDSANRDIQLYRGAADRLRTPDSVTIDAKLTVGGTRTTKMIEVGAGTDTTVRTEDGVRIQTAGSAGVILRDDTNDVETFLLTASTGGFVGTATAHSLLLRTSNTTRITIDSAGAINLGSNAVSNLKLGNTMEGNAQIIQNVAKLAIGAAAPATSTLLDITGTTGALLVPRMTTAQRDALTATNGMVLYNTTTNTMQGYINGAWTNL